MKKFILASKALLLLSTPVQLNASSVESLGKYEFQGPVMYAGDYSLDMDPENSLIEAIKGTVYAGGVYSSSPLHLVIGKGIIDNEGAFNQFIEYLNRILAEVAFRDFALVADPSVEYKIVKIDAGFLKSRNLNSFSIKGFENLETIGDDFLHYNFLTFFSGEDFKNLKTIGKGFLVFNNLSSFSAKGFENVEQIGDGFLMGNADLVSVDLRSFAKLRSIGREFLTGCGVKEVIVANEAQKKLFENHIKMYNPEAKIIIK